MNFQTGKLAISDTIVKHQQQEVMASWYDYDLTRPDQKCKADNCYSMFNNTCASRDYPKGTRLTIYYKDKSVVCRVNDYVENPKVELDLSSSAFKTLAPLSLGLIKIKIYEKTYNNYTMETGL